MNVRMSFNPFQIAHLHRGDSTAVHVHQDASEKDRRLVGSKIIRQEDTRTVGDRRIGFIIAITLKDSTIHLEDISIHRLATANPVQNVVGHAGIGNNATTKITANATET